MSEWYIEEIGHLNKEREGLCNQIYGLKGEVTAKDKELRLLKAIRHEAENVLVAYATAEGEGLDACEDLAVALEDYNKGMAND